MASQRQSLPAWIAGLVDGAIELRIRGGASSASWEPIGVLRRPFSVDDVAVKVANAGEPPSVRVDAYDDRGKHLDSWQSSASAAAAGALQGGNPEIMPAGADAQAAMAWAFGRMMLSNERLIGALAQPVAALSELFSSERTRRETETDRREQAETDARALEALLSRVADASEDAPDALREQAAGVVGSLRENMPTILELLAGRFGRPPA
jgi:hypothetical protein